MRVGNFSVVVPEGIERDSGHVGLDHGRQYTIRLMNHDHRRCDAEVTVDGKAMGAFRLMGHGQMALERFPNDPGRLTFYSTGTTEASQAGEVSVAVLDKGLIQVRFVPERRRAEPVLQPTRARPIGLTGSGGGSAQSMPMGFGPEEKTSGGITGLSGSSDQQFVTVGNIDRDESAAVTISLRLITAVSGPRPLQALGGNSNTVPEPV